MVGGRLAWVGGSHVNYVNVSGRLVSGNEYEWLVKMDDDLFRVNSLSTLVHCTWDAFNSSNGSHFSRIK
jgi:hypothetical protein